MTKFLRVKEGNNIPVRYKLRYLPLFYEDILSVVGYIRIVLKNDIAADNLIDAVDKAIKDRLPVCESFWVTKE